MSLHWRISSLPELGHLDVGQRRALLREAIPLRTLVWLWVRPIVIGLLAMLVTLLVLAILEKHMVAPWIVWPAFAGGVVFAHLQQVARVRAQIRDEVITRLQGEPSPVCLTCGFDLRGAAGDGVCPECGESVRVG